MHQALYRKYRPATFDRVCGQRHITDVLNFQVENNRTSHAYLFCGSRGTGKTSSAKILAKAVNCESPVGGSPCLCCRSCLDIDAGLAPDVIELDAASNNGVDDIRDICDKAAYMPSMLKKKVYIIDEVHMLSQSAFNALLKTIEEPPEHVIFILATTEFHKVPATIVSRCQRFDFRRIDMKIIAENLMYIAKSEGIVLENEAALLIGRQAEGGMRDAIGLFELCSAGGADVTASEVSQVLGLSGYDRALGTMELVARGDMAKLFGTVSDVVSSSKDISVFWKELISVTRDMLVSKYTDSPKDYLDLTDQETEMLLETAKLFNLQQLVYHCKVLDDAAARMIRDPATKRTTAEFALLRMCRPELDTSNDALSARISKLEDAFALGTPVASPAPVAPVENKAEPAPAPAASPAPAPAAAAPAPEISSAPKAAPAGGNEYERVRDISEAVGRLDGTNRGLASFLMSSEAYVSRDGKKLLLKVEGFAAMMFKSEESKNAVANAFALARITDGVATVTVETIKAGEKKTSAADDLSGWL
ncbi:MAG: DNA polymerase III subunit gamma/tau [Ruminococcaceae bacterium]|nr:DNA polymerase III subunit gamma/tau [Oscillospiraceae bacterium]